MPFSPDELAKLVNDYRTESEEGHGRLRGDFKLYHDQTETTLMLMRDAANTLRGRVDLIERTPQDVMKLRFSTGVVLSLVFFVASAVGSAYGFSSFIGGKVDTMSRRMDEQSAAQAKASEERAASAQRSLDALSRRVELQGYELQRLREDVTKATKGK